MKYENITNRTDKESENVAIKVKCNERSQRNPGLDVRKVG